MAIKVNGATVISDTQAITSTSTISATGNVTGGNVVTAGIISATGNISTGGTIIATTIVANIAPPTGGTVSTTGNVTGGNVLTGGVVSATGNITGSYILGNGSQLTGIDATSIQNGTSNVKVVSSGGNVAVSVGGTSNVAVWATTGEYVTGVVSASGNITGGNVLTGGLISATSTVTGGNVLTGGQVSATGNVTGGNVNAGNITLAGDLISSLGTTLTIDPASTGNAGLVVIAGNLQVNGTTTTINSNVVSTNDLTVNYANNAINSAAANGGGIEIGPIGSPYITWLYNNTANVFTSSGGVSAVGNITGSAFVGSGAGLTSIPGANVTGTVANATYATSAGSATSATTAGTVTTNAQPNITSVGSLSSVTVTGNVSGGNLLTGGLLSATSTVTGSSLLGSVVSVTANVTGGNILTGGLISATGAITGAAITGSSLTVSTGNISGGNINNNNANGVGNIGSATTYFNTVFAKATSAQYADLAELYTADADYEPGTVVEFGGTAEVTLSNKPGSTRVAGVVSTNPSYIMNATLQAEHVAVVALQGRVPCKVIGPVSKGDIMVASGGGYAKVDNNAKAGTIIGKALEVLHTPHGVIEVVVGRN